MTVDTTHWPHSEIMQLRQDILKLYEERRAHELKLEHIIIEQYTKIQELTGEIERLRANNLHGCTSWRK